jgi:hypothetical protein
MNFPSRVLAVLRERYKWWEKGVEAYRYSARHLEAVWDAERRQLELIIIAQELGFSREDITK